MDLKKYIQDHKSEFDDQKLSKQVDESFESLLKDSLHTPKKGRVVYLKYLSVAASVAILISTSFWMYNIRLESSQRQEIISNLTADSTGKRLEAVYEFDDEFRKEDQQIIDVLINTLLNDNNANVKIATIDALLKFPQNEKIRKNMIKALGQETKPNVQIKLIKALSTLREKRAKEPLEEIIKDETTFDIVKNSATLAMTNLKK